ncbi:MAG: DUF86 domain-containing protein [Armatimonadia bacterium]|nr:DUF86 domain-containing protein [Armatimonadia bacterium]
MRSGPGYRGGPANPHAGQSCVRGGDAVRSVADRARDILAAIDNIDRYTKGRRPSEIRDERDVVWVIHHLQIIGEAARHIPDDVRQGMPEIPWRQIVGMRNMLVHGYFIVDKSVALGTIESDLPSLRSALKAYLADNPAESDPGAES